jgi:hypothetical protein
MKNFIYCSLLALFFSSCTEIIEVDIPENTEKLMVEGNISTELDSSFVRLSLTVPYFGDNKPYPVVPNATVNVNGVNFTYDTNGIYRPAKPYIGIVGNTYTLSVSYNGQQYSSSSFLEPMFQIDSIVPTYKEPIDFLEAGYTVTYYGKDTRSQVKNTYLRFGFKGVDSISDFYEDFRVLFDNKGQDPNRPLVFEVPFVRLAPGDTNILVFRSIDQAVYRYYLALNNRSDGGGPFSTPPANLPTNIKGKDALGLFAAYDIKRYRTAIPK